jgi:hypothetical protein
LRSLMWTSSIRSAAECEKASLETTSASGD